VLALKSAAFRAEREGSWRELERLVRKAERRGVRALAGAELSRLPLLYRATVSSLSVARAISLDQNVLGYLESLCARSYLLVYGTRRELREVVDEFFGRRFPAVLRKRRWYVALALSLLVAGIATGFALVTRDSERFYSFVPPAMAQGRGPTASTEALRDVLYTKDGVGHMLRTFAMFLFTNNAQVSLLAFALGFAGGAPSALLIYSNGLTMGVLAALYHGRGLSLELWAWLLPHGVTELLAVALCGAAGLLIGRALVFPGQRERLSALAEDGREAAVLVLGAVAMLFIAALVEGIFRQLVHSLVTRYSVAAAFALFWALYFSLAGRSR
jgi:uncharacterized membrane protein SpoIIM required for sporulation